MNPYEERAQKAPMRPLASVSPGASRIFGSALSAADVVGSGKAKGIPIPDPMKRNNEGVTQQLFEYQQAHKKQHERMAQKPNALNAKKKTPVVKQKLPGLETSSRAKMIESFRAKTKPAPDSVIDLCGSSEDEASLPPRPPAESDEDFQAVKPQQNKKKRTDSPIVSSASKPTRVAAMKSTAKIQLPSTPVVADPIPWKLLTHPLIEPWAVDLFAQTLDLFILDLPGTDDLIERLCHSFIQKNIVQHRNARLAHIYEGKREGEYRSVDWNEDVDSGIVEYFIGLVREGCLFQPALIIALGGVLAICPKDVWIHWKRLGGPMDTTPPPSAPPPPLQYPDTEVIDVDADPIQEEPNEPATPAPPHNPFSLIETNLQTKLLKLLHILPPVQEYVECVSEGDVGPVGVGIAVVGNELRVFERLWGGCREVDVNEKKVGDVVDGGVRVERESGGVGVPERQYISTCLYDEDDDDPDFIDTSFTPLPPTLLRGCECPATSRCSTTETCQCIAGSNGPVYQHDALRDVVATRVVECGDACGCAEVCWNRVARDDYVRGEVRRGLVVKGTRGCGWGLYTTTDIQHGSYIGDYVGHRVAMNGIRVRRVMVRAGVQGVDMVVVRDEGRELFGVDATYNCGVVRFVIYQRSKIPTPPRLALFAMHHIPAGAELSLNYADLDTGGPEYYGPCACGVEGCTGVVGQRKVAEGATVEVGKKKGMKRKNGKR
ncbi:histone H3-K9 methyltransferase KMT1 [Podochytrium sp. JEL0797]|nr:histone H3-K9 methyltransferase KMT1 [Podochytrium sp. JEL0797]